MHISYARMRAANEALGQKWFDAETFFGTILGRQVGEYGPPGERVIVFVFSDHATWSSGRTTSCYRVGLYGEATGVVFTSENTGGTNGRTYHASALFLAKNHVRLHGGTLYTPAIGGA